MSCKRERGTIGSSEGIIATGTAWVSLTALAILMAFAGAVFQPGSAACILRRLDERWKKEGKRGEYLRQRGTTAGAFFATHISANMVPAFLAMYKEKLQRDQEVIFERLDRLEDWGALNSGAKAKAIKEATRPRS